MKSQKQIREICSAIMQSHKINNNSSRLEVLEALIKAYEQGRQDELYNPIPISDLSDEAFAAIMS